MNFHYFYRFSFFILVGLVNSACGMFDSQHQWDYQKSESTANISVPEHLQQPSQSHEFDVPNDDPSLSAASKEDIAKLEIPPEMHIDSVAIEDLVSVTAAEKNRLIVRAARNTDGYNLLVVDSDFDIVWERVGDSFKEIGFKIEDKNRGQGFYSIYQTINKILTEEEEFLRPRFDKGIREEYQVHVEDRDTQSRITIKNTRGKIDDSALAKHLLTQIKAQLSETITEEDRAVEVDRIDADAAADLE